MYIEPFWCGVIATIVTEIVVFIIWGLSLGLKEAKRKEITYEQNNKGTTRTNQMQKQERD